jgi:hypothetical protein
LLQKRFRSWGGDYGWWLLLVSAATSWKRMFVGTVLWTMTASDPRDVLWLHAERGDRQKQSQQAKNRHEEVQRFFHANEFDALSNRFDTD